MNQILLPALNRAILEGSSEQDDRLSFREDVWPDVYYTRTVPTGTRWRRPETDGNGANTATATIA
jgi:hypothetical protein